MERKTKIWTGLLHPPPILEHNKHRCIIVFIRYRDKYILSIDVPHTYFRRPAFGYGNWTGRTKISTQEYR